MKHQINFCDCVIPKPISAYEADKNICSACGDYITHSEIDYSEPLRKCKVNDNGVERLGYVVLHNEKERFAHGVVFYDEDEGNYRYKTFNLKNFIEIGA
jgi:hypothetical protein